MGSQAAGMAPSGTVRFSISPSSSDEPSASSRLLLVAHLLNTCLCDVLAGLHGLQEQYWALRDETCNCCSSDFGRSYMSLLQLYRAGLQRSRSGNVQRRALHVQVSGSQASAASI